MICLWRSRFPPLLKPVLFHLRALSRVYSLLTCEAADAVALCLILSRLDYCNSLLVGLPPVQIKRLQAVQNAAARVVVRQRKFDHITPTLRELHWLPVHDCFPHRLLSVIYGSVHENMPLSLCAHSAMHSISFSLIGRQIISCYSCTKDCKTKRYGQ